MNKPKTYILNFWKTILTSINWLCPFQLISKIINRFGFSISHAFVDTWVLGHFILAWTVLFIFGYIYPQWLVWTLIILAAIRMIEIITYQLSILLFDQYKNKDYALAGYRRILVLSIMNYIEILLWFAIFYRYLRIDFYDTNKVLSTAIGSLYYSMVTISTLGYGEIYPISSLGRVVVTAQIAIGIFLLVLILSRIISYLPKPNSMDHEEGQ